MAPNRRKRKKRQRDHNKELDRHKRVQVENVVKRLLGTVEAWQIQPCEGCPHGKSWHSLSNDTFVAAANGCMYHNCKCKEFRG